VGFGFAFASVEGAGPEAERTPGRWAVREAGEDFAVAWGAPLSGVWRWREVVVMVGTPSTTMSGWCDDLCRLAEGGL
jgi:hypothetical protein